MSPYPRILYGHSFQDSYRVIRDPDTSNPVTSEPRFLCDLDAFVRTEKQDKDFRFQNYAV
jgi:hypothetical protein